MVELPAVWHELQYCLYELCPREAAARSTSYGYGGAGMFTVKGVVRSTFDMLMCEGSPITPNSAARFRCVRSLMLPSHCAAGLSSWRQTLMMSIIAGAGGTA